MTRESILMQYQSECLEALKSVANIGKPFEKVFMDAMKLFMAIPGRMQKDGNTIFHLILQVDDTQCLYA